MTRLRQREDLGTEQVLELRWVATEKCADLAGIWRVGRYPSRNYERRIWL